MSVDDFAILAFVDPIGIVTTPSGMEISEGQRHGSLRWTPCGRRIEWRIRSSSRRGDILLGAPPNFGSFRAAKMTPFWDPNFTPSCGQLGATYLYAQGEPGPNLKLYTQIEVLGTRDAGSNSHEFARIRIRPEFARIRGPLRIRIRNFKFESSLIRLIESIGTYNLPSRLHFTCLHMGMPLPGTISHKRFPKSFRNLAFFVVCCCLHLPC